MSKNTLSLVVLLLIFTINMQAQWGQVGQSINGESADDRSGVAVAMNADGSVVAVGANNNDNSNGIAAGHVRVYRKENNSWMQIGQDIDGEAAYDNLGTALDISADGNTVVIAGTTGDFAGTDNNDNRGYLIVYKNVNDTWTQVGSKVYGEEQGDQFGKSVSISADGTIIAGSSDYNPGTGLDYAGHVRVYQLSGNIFWTQIGQDIDGNEEDAQSGWSISLNAAGNRIAVGAVASSVSQDEAGQVRVYQNTANSWVQLGQDLNGTTEYDNFGFAVSLNADGNYLAVGTPGHDGATDDNIGNVGVYQLIGNAWSLVNQPIEGEKAYELSGDAVDLSDDGSIVAIGAPYYFDAISSDGMSNDDKGITRIYQNTGAAWSLLDFGIKGENEFDNSGLSISLRADGGEIVIGAMFNDDGGDNSGHARVFTNQPLGVDDVSLATNFSMYPNPVKDILTIQSSSEKINSITIYDLNGKMVYSEKSPTRGVYVGDLSPGMYLVKVTRSNTVLVDKLIKL